MSAVRFESVDVTFPGGNRVIEGFNLEIAHGELLTLVGPSGCGKSTLLNVLAGFERPSAGAVYIDGRRVDLEPPRARGLAMVFQSYALYPHLSVRENVGFPLRVAGVGRKEIEARVASTAERLGLTPLLDRVPRELSGGQRQRVALARALVRRPRICLFDEPLSNLDAGLRSQMRAEIKKLHEDLGATFIYVTHDQSEAMTLSDRLVVLNRGRIEQEGAPSEVYEKPNSTFVAAFVGAPAINLLPPSALGLRDAPGGATLGVRPERLRVVSAGAGVLDAPVWVVEPTGPETWVTVDLDGARAVGRAPPDLRCKPGEMVGLSYHAADLHLFDDKTGRRFA